MEEGKYPWIVQMSMGCTGALIDSTHVLTAAHCFLGSKYYVEKPKRADAANITVSLGTNINIFCRSSPPYCYPAVVANVSDYTLHPTWETLDLLGADIAVVTLSSPVQYSDKVKPICLPSNPGQNYVGKVAVASGFGADKYHKPQDNLMETNVKIISEKDCFNNIKEEVTGSAPKWNMSISEEDVRKSLKTKICTKGSPINNNPDWTTGTREGDSGSALNFEEYERFQM